MTLNVYKKEYCTFAAAFTATYVSPSPPLICVCQVVGKGPHPPHLVGDIMGVVGGVVQGKAGQGKEFRLTKVPIMKGQAGHS